eukprot:m.250228 g.250228  ORF g.250228 m.250228 type:complete len:55 (+) comp116341_c0_seq1:252-416(+)
MRCSVESGLTQIVCKERIGFFIKENCADIKMSLPSTQKEEFAQLDPACQQVHHS